MTGECRDYLIDVISSMEKTQDFILNMNYEDFIKDEKTVLATIRLLEIIGEASKRIPENIRKLNPDIPWKDMSGMRDILIHDYFGIDYETVWLTVNEKIPRILPLIKNLAKEV